MTDMAWMYDGYTKVKEGQGRKARYVETYIYKCLHCGKEVRTDDKPPRYCPNCGNDNRVEKDKP